MKMSAYIVKSIFLLLISNSNNNMKKVIYILGILLVSLLAVAVLYVQAKLAKPKVKNGFNRLFISTEPLSHTRVMDIEFNSYYIAGLSKKDIYLGNFTATTHLLITDYNLKDTHRVELNIPDDKKLAWGILRTKVDSPYIFIMEGRTPTVFQGLIGKYQYKSSNLNYIPFDKSIPTTISKFVLRSYDTTLKQNILLNAMMVDINNGRETYVLDKQVDGIFCTDGMLKYSHDLSQIIYIYYYKNKFVGLDTNLNVLYHGKTIDTVSQVNLKTDTIKSENKTILTNPPVIVNKESAVYADRLFIHSKLIADNEQRMKFEKNSVIDVYSLIDHSYEFSFYLPKYNDEKLLEFRVYEDNLISINKNYLLVYNLQSLNVAQNTEAKKTSKLNSGS